MAKNNLIAEIISVGQSKDVEKLEKLLNETETKQVISLNSLLQNNLK